MSALSEIPREDFAFYINHLRALSVDCVQAANSGHPGMPLGMAPCAYMLFAHTLKFDASSPDWFDRDRFVLSNGHGCTLLYSLLHMCGFDQLSLSQLSKFRKLGSCTPGHPERGVTAGVEVTTGPLGQGLANAVGMAIAETHLASRLNIKGEDELIDHHTFVFCGDGCLMEGIGQEALSLAGHLGLDKLVVIYDDNQISIDGSTSLSFTEDSQSKYASMGFDVYAIENGDSDYSKIQEVLLRAKHARNKRPKFIALRTTIGFGSEVAGSAKVHGAPLGPEGVRLLKKNLNIKEEYLDKPFSVPQEAYAPYHLAAMKGKAENARWQEVLERYKTLYRNSQCHERKLFEYVFMNANTMSFIDAIDSSILPKEPIASRKASEIVLGKLIEMSPFLIGGSADLSGSNLTIVGEMKKCSFQKDSPQGRYIHYGVREHAMAGIANGIVAHGGLIPYCGTFLNFIGYCLGAVRLSALSHLGVVYVATHDSIGLGEDGPTHQPTEISAVLRAMPNLLLLRPADSRETLECWKIALQERSTPSVLCLSRHALPSLPSCIEDRVIIEGVSKGGYTLCTKGKLSMKPSIVLLSTGSEVHLCLQAADELIRNNYLESLSVVSMPCLEKFRLQSSDYQITVLPDGIPVLAVEAWTSQCWAEFAHAVIGIDKFGCSAPQTDCYKLFGVTVDNIVKKSVELLKKFQYERAPSKKLL
uniref:transketolase n=1 Tax=Perkinsela sp. SMB-60 TaxID=1840652 RepID=A0A161HS54_9EUGL|nr:transketolase [Perkinsela sp. SMB-60]